VMAPADENECRQMLYTAFTIDGPSAVRYPRGAGSGVEVQSAMSAIPVGRGEVRREGRRVAILAFGSILQASPQAGEGPQPGTRGGGDGGGPGSLAGPGRTAKGIKGAAAVFRHRDRRRRRGGRGRGAPWGGGGGFCGPNRGGQELSIRPLLNHRRPIHELRAGTGRMGSRSPRCSVSQPAGPTATTGGPGRTDSTPSPSS